MQNKLQVGEQNIRTKKKKKEQIKEYGKRNIALGIDILKSFSSRVAQYPKEFRAPPVSLFDVVEEVEITYIDYVRSEMLSNCHILAKAMQIKRYSSRNIKSIRNPRIIERSFQEPEVVFSGILVDF